jgi:hypothetical protein
VAFSDFQTIEQVIGRYPLKVRQERFLPDVKAELPGWFIENLSFLLDMRALDESETFFSESFIFPLLQQAWKKHRKLKLWSHRILAYDNELFGEPDYLISALTEDATDRLVSRPLLAVAEAKKEDFTKGWAQCLAEMICCQKINKNDSVVIYGIVSTGIFWEFGKLDGNIFTKHPVSYSIGEPERVFGLVDFLFAECEKSLARAETLGVSGSEVNFGI